MGCSRRKGRNRSDQGTSASFRRLLQSGSKGGSRGVAGNPCRILFRQDHFDPFTGGKKNAGKLAAPFWQREHVEDWANEAAAAWRRWFVHDRVMKGLRVNRLLPRCEVHVDVHYAFLSGFAHPSKRGYEALHGRNTPDRMGTFDHYASELCLLYVLTIAAAELEAYGRMTRRTPVIGLSGWDEVMLDVRMARFESSYFWFLGEGPTSFRPQPGRRPFAAQARALSRIEPSGSVGSDARSRSRSSSRAGSPNDARYVGARPVPPRNGVQ